MIAVRLSRPVPAGVLERLPHRALGHLGVAAQAPTRGRAAGRARLPAIATPTADRQALAERAGGHVGRRDPRGRVALEPRAELAERQQLLVVDRARRLEHRVVQRRRVALGEDQVVVVRVVRVRRSRAAGGRPSARPSGRPPTSRTSGGPSRRPREARTESTRSCWPSSRRKSASWAIRPATSFSLHSRSANRSAKDLANFSTPSLLEHLDDVVVVDARRP